MSDGPFAAIRQEHCARLPFALYCTWERITTAVTDLWRQRGDTIMFGLPFSARKMDAGLWSRIEAASAHRKQLPQRGAKTDFDQIANDTNRATLLDYRAMDFLSPATRK